MHFEHCGAGDAILFIHGMPTSGRLWRGITDRLQARYTCFTIDLPGLGKSPRERYGPDYLRLLAGRIDAFRVAKSANGMSLAMTLARSSPCTMPTTINSTSTVWPCWRQHSFRSSGRIT
jgi:pimeloyl-ACP methyl ester carboxylesterase